MDNVELNLNELEEVKGGFGGSPTKLPHKAGYIVYHIVKGDNLTRIAKNYGTTVKAIVACNPTITDKNDITAGFWIYIPE